MFNIRGTALILFLVAITMVGNTIKDKVKPPIKDDERGICNKLINIDRPSKPKIMEGIAAMLLMLISIKSANLFFTANSSKYKAIKHQEEMITVKKSLW